MIVVYSSFELGKQASFVYDAINDESRASFYKTYSTLNTMDKLEKVSKQQGINILENP